MSSLPLSSAIYHAGTKPCHEHFYPRVREASHKLALSMPDTIGRVLLLVYPPPGPMAAEALRCYIKNFDQGSDTLVYVGEGRGGVNADNAFFNALQELGDWVVMDVIDLPSGSGTSKGFERMFVLKKVPETQNQSESDEKENINVNRALQWRG
mmetsp:Transcript_3157/g.3174  ORF Transcript_3157/g.3174 Transcript_3157/m.3174 type:complete len:153 (-) Transcript_3157:93-551(-)